MVDLEKRLRGRARFLRDRWQIKSPELMEEAADALSAKDAEITSLRAEVERMQNLLDGRDAFIVRKGLWDDFVDELPARAALGGTDE